MGFTMTSKVGCSDLKKKSGEGHKILIRVVSEHRKLKNIDGAFNQTAFYRVPSLTNNVFYLLSIQTDVLIDPNLQTSRVGHNNG
jgi:hypothetical protein